MWFEDATWGIPKNMPKPMTPGRWPYEKPFRHQPPISSRSPPPKLDIAKPSDISREEEKKRKNKKPRTKTQ